MSGNKGTRRTPNKLKGCWGPEGRPDDPPKNCATCGKEIRSWFSQNHLLPKVFCAEHHTFLGIHAKD